MDQGTNDVRERMQEVARMISVMLPPNTGFALLAFDFGDTPTRRLEYVSNAKREDIVKSMIEWIKTTADGKFGHHLSKAL